MSKARVFGQDVALYFGNTTDISNRICELTNFDVKHDDILKEGNSLGENGVGSIDVIDNGGSGSCEAEMTSAELEAIFVRMSEHHRGTNVGERGRAFYWNILRKITFADDSTSTVVYEGAVLHSPSDTVSGRTENMMNKFEFKYKKRYMLTAGADAVYTADLGKARVEGILTSNFLALSGNVSSSIPDIQPLLYSDPSGGDVQA